MKFFVLGLLFLLPSCTSGLFAGDAVERKDSAELVLLKDTLTKGARAQATHYVEEGTYTFNLSELDLTVPRGVAIAITQLSNQDYCMTGTHKGLPGVIWYVSTAQTVPTEGTC